MTTINLFAPFTSNAAAQQIAEAITQKLNDPDTKEAGVAYVGDSEIAEWVSLEIDNPEAVWPIVAVSSQRLAYVAERYASKGELCPLTSTVPEGESTPMTTIAKLFDLGQYHSTIGSHHWSKNKLGSFSMYEVKTKKDLRRPDLSLWVNNSEQQQRIRMTPTHYGLPLGTKEQCDTTRSFVTQLFYNLGMRWTSQRCLAAMTEKPCLSGNTWLALINDDPVIRFGFAVYANSALGFMVNWSRAGKQQNGRAIIRKTALAKLPCPDFTDPNIHARAANLLATHPDLETLELLPAAQANIDENRHKLNEACCEMLGLPVEVLNDLADAWVEEPSVSGLEEPTVSE